MHRGDWREPAPVQRQPGRRRRCACRVKGPERCAEEQFVQEGNAGYRGRNQCTEGGRNGSRAALALPAEGKESVGFEWELGEQVGHSLRPSHNGSAGAAR